MKQLDKYCYETLCLMSNEALSNRPICWIKCSFETFSPVWSMKPNGTEFDRAILSGILANIGKAYYRIRRNVIPLPIPRHPQPPSFSDAAPVSHWTRRVWVHGEKQRIFFQYWYFNVILNYHKAWDILATTQKLKIAHIDFNSIYSVILK